MVMVLNVLSWYIIQGLFLYYKLLFVGWSFNYVLLAADWWHCCPPISFSISCHSSKNCQNLQVRMKRVNFCTQGKVSKVKNTFEESVPKGGNPSPLCGFNFSCSGQLSWTAFSIKESYWECWCKSWMCLSLQWQWLDSGHQKRHWRE